ncbi:MAG: hypothetical protein U1F76_06495 [Candidatus Competibacteraceae bacterium]
MKLRIIAIPQETATVIQINGQLRAEGITELERLCAAAHPPLVLDLACLRSLDSRGVEALNKLTREGARVIEASPYIELLLSRSRRR